MAKNLKYINTQGEKQSKRNRRTLSVEDVFKKPRYRCIIKLIYNFSKPDSKKKIKFAHLKYALVKGADSCSEYKRQRMESFFSDPFHESQINGVQSDYKKGLIDRKTYLSLMKIVKKSILDTLRTEGLLHEEDNFSCEQTLRDALKNIKKLKLIKKEPDKKGYSYYILTRDGLGKISKWMLHESIDDLPDNSYAVAQLLGLSLFYNTGFKIQNQSEKLKKNTGEKFTTDDTVKTNGHGLS